MDEIIATSYDPILVAASYLLAVLGAYIALSGVYKLRAFRDAYTAHRIERLTAARAGQTDTGDTASLPGVRIYMATLIVAGVAFGGIGVWSMHFLGMLALRMTIEVNYNMASTVLSLLVSVMTAIWGFGIVARNPNSHLRLLAAGMILGLGVSAMHYLGMGSMYFSGYFLWDWNTVALSIGIALIAATAGLWLAFNTPSIYTRTLAAIIMGLAVCAMHYTGMEAAQVVCTTDALQLPVRSGMLDTLQLPVLIGTLLVGFALTVGLDRMYAPHIGKRPALGGADPL